MSSVLRVNFGVLGPVRLLHWFFVRIFFRVKIHGKEHIPQQGPVILVPTHRSRWDAFFLQMTTVRMLHPMTSHDEFIGIQGWFLHKLGAFPVDTRKPSPGVIKLCREMLREGRILVIFAEGTIFYYGPNQVHPIKQGPAWIVLACQKDDRIANIPIVPIRLNYVKYPLRLFGRVEVLVQPPIHAKDFAQLPRDEAQSTLTGKLQAEMGDFVNESMLEMAVPRTPPAPVVK